MKRPTRMPGWIARGAAITFCIAGIIAGTGSRPVAPSQAPAPAVALAGPLSAPAADDPIAAALVAARRAYAGGELRAARAWIGIAAENLDTALAAGNDRHPWQLGNASQLLEYLQLYGLFAYGSRPELDRQYEQLERELGRVAVLNRAPVQPSQVAGEAVSYDLLSHLVRRIGNLQIGYDLITQQITSLGDLRISYDLITRQPTRIGDIEYRYDLIDRTVRSVAGVGTD